MSKKPPNQSATAKTSAWITLLSSGAVVTAISFVAPKLWDYLKHKPASVETVSIAFRVESAKVLVFARNQSDDVIDFTSASIAINDARLASIKTHGAFPEISKIYILKGYSHSAYSVAIVNDALVFKLGIAQTIAPLGVDQFGIEIESALESLQLRPESISVEMTDMKGRTYIATKN